jgi:hypothetical protein|tara:strand:- start:346 stop:750 length:405 start_codon:yes stop_codon:yes gene_type:complete
MSWATCYSGSNNIHFGFPPIMTDGRNYADWQPNAVVNNQIIKEAGIKSNWQYRKYLMENADSIIKLNQVESCNQCCTCPAVYGNHQQISNTPFLYKSCTDSSQPYGYENSNLKNLYLSKQQLNCRKMAPQLKLN